MLLDEKILEELYNIRDYHPSCTPAQVKSPVALKILIERGWVCIATNPVLAYMLTDLGRLEYMWAVIDFRKG